MSEAVMDSAGQAEPEGKAGVVSDFSRDKQVFPVPWGKAFRQGSAWRLPAS